ncbi:MAG: T9SS type A sorting domain-containing protein [Bacteroidales bacterium]|nr:T9SS type A sorting domain-containing protein [Bacteroidales bacterium]
MKNNILFLCSLLFSIISQAQIISDTTWERWYEYPELEEVSREKQQTMHYDNGIVYMANYDLIPLAKMMLIKTDVNGLLLWKQKIDTLYPLALISASQTVDNGIVIGGVTMKTGFGNPIIIKLNSCMELEWCKIIYKPLYSHVSEVKVDHNGDIVVLTFTDDYEPHWARVNIIKLNNDGDILWENDYVTMKEYPLIWSPLITTLNISNDNNYYLSGECVWPDNDDPNQQWRRHALIIKINENGDEEWILPIGIYDEKSTVWRTDALHQIDDTTFSYLFYDWNIYQPFITIFNNNGEVIRNKTKIQFPELGDLQSFEYPEYLGNNTYMAIWHHSFQDEYPIEHHGYVVFDTALRILSYKEDDRWDYRYNTLLSHDHKFINLATVFNSQGSENRDIYMAKLNTDLSYADTIDDTNWLYDYECSHEVESGYIELGCEIVGAEEQDLPSPEEYAAKQKKIGINLSPNPANNYINIYMDNTAKFKNIELEIFDIAGKKKYTESILTGLGEQKINTQNWEEGMYIIIIRSDNIVVGNAKFVIEK